MNHSSRAITQVPNLIDLIVEAKVIEQNFFLRARVIGLIARRS